MGRILATEGGSDDIRNLYGFLKRFGGICSSHTSATNMETDWRDYDPEIEPVVEIFQGHRQSYEETNAPLAASGPEETIQGYRPLGFVWNAFAKGRRLGFQASSDHVREKPVSPSSRGSGRTPRCANITLRWPLG